MYVRAVVPLYVRTYVRTMEISTLRTVLYCTVFRSAFFCKQYGFVVHSPRRLFPFDLVEVIRRAGNICDAFEGGYDELFGAGHSISLLCVVLKRAFRTACRVVRVNVILYQYSYSRYVNAPHAPQNLKMIINQE